MICLVAVDFSSDRNMGLLNAQLLHALPASMTIPDSLTRLYDWIEARQTYIDGKDGKRIGFLFPESEQRASWTDKERFGGTIVEFAAQGNEGLEYWFGHHRPEIRNRLCVFAKTGVDGSVAAFWLDNVGRQRIVHMGSGSGSTLVCVLAEDAVDFIRLLAIGYDEICWSSEFAFPPNHKRSFIVHPHTEFQRWVIETFAVTIPSTASTIVQNPYEMGDEPIEDIFAQWVFANTEFS